MFDNEEVQEASSVERNPSSLEDEGGDDYFSLGEVETEGEEGL